MSVKQSLVTLKKVTNDVMSNVTCTKRLRWNVSSPNPNVQVEAAFNVIKGVIVKKFLGFPLLS